MKRHVAIAAVLSLQLVGGAQTTPAAGPILENVDLMDIVIKPAYDDLQQAMTAEPVDRKAWAALYQRAARLAESENLIFLRTRAAEDRRSEWSQRAAQARQASADVACAALAGLRNARSEDFDAVRSKFPAVAGGCNACHRAFSREAPAIRP
jgi:cytochrome c556